MAIVVSPFGSSMVSGSLGGIVFSRGHGGNYVRRKAKNCVRRFPNSKQYKVVEFNQAIDAWRSLSSQEIAAWSAFAENQVSSNCLGQKIVLSPYNWFLKFVCAQIFYGFEIDTIPPLFLIPSYHPKISISYTLAGYEISFDQAIPADHKIAIREGRYNTTFPVGHRASVQSTILDSTASNPTVFTAPCGAGSGTENLAPIQCLLFNQFEVFTVNSKGCQSPRLFFQIQAVA